MREYKRQSLRLDNNTVKSESEYYLLTKSIKDKYFIVEVVNGTTRVRFRKPSNKASENIEAKRKVLGELEGIIRSAVEVGKESEVREAMVLVGILKNKTREG